VVEHVTWVCFAFSARSPFLTFFVLVFARDQIVFNPHTVECVLTDRKAFSDSTCLYQGTKEGGDKGDGSQKVRSHHYPEKK
jgi:hypothetical protein